MNFNPLITHVLNSTPKDQPIIRRSLWWAVAIAFIIGIAFGRFSVVLR